ncbi:MAG TPA: hypothetical protein PLX50_03005 [Candidatus Aminicenantes bacterium]|nr:hypothetical protein [Candidatus Aminicenantes bacterium]
MNAKTKALIVFSLIAVFAIGVMAGFFGDRFFVHKKSAPRDKRPPRFPTVEMMAKELELTPEQQALLRDVFSRNEEKLKSLRTEIHQRLADIRRQLKADVENILTPEQKRKFEAMLERHIQQRREERKAREDKSRRERPPDPDKGERE